MAFKKGESGNLKGKPKGTPNKSTVERREFIKSLLDNEHDHIIDALKKTRTRYPHLYLAAISNLMEFDTPKLSRAEIKHQEVPSDKHFTWEEIKNEGNTENNTAL